MTTPPEKPAGPIPLSRDRLDSTLKKNTRERDAIANDGSPQIEFVRGFLKNWENNYKEKTIAEKHAEATIDLGKKIGWLFTLSVLAFVITGCYLSVWSDDTHIKNLVSIIQTVGTLLTWAVGFVMGHYFTNKNDR